MEGLQGNFPIFVSDQTNDIYGCINIDQKFASLITAFGISKGKLQVVFTFPRGTEATEIMSFQNSLENLCKREKIEATVETQKAHYVSGGVNLFLYITVPK
jgi:hypothetical protein